MAGHEPIQVHLPRGARRYLKRRMQECKEAKLHVRYNIVVLYAEQWGTEEIAATLGCSTSTAIRAANRFLAEGEAGLFDRRIDNGERKVDDDRVAALVEVVADRPPTYGWARPTWTSELLALTLSEVTHTQVSPTTVRRMLHSFKARWGMPRATVLCTWPKRKKDKRCLAGGLNPKCGGILWVVGERRNADLFIKFLRCVDTTFPDAKKIHLILDRCKSHTCPRVQQVLETEFGGRIVLHLLPPYSPEHNPIERLWKELHANVTRNHRCRTIEELLPNGDYFLEHVQPYPGTKASLAQLNSSSAA